MLGLEREREIERVSPGHVHMNTWLTKRILKFAYSNEASQIPLKLYFPKAPINFLRRPASNSAIIFRIHSSPHECLVCRPPPRRFPTREHRYRRQAIEEGVGGKVYVGQVSGPAVGNALKLLFGADVKLKRFVGVRSGRSIVAALHT